MAPNEYHITCEADPSREVAWIVRVWIRSTAESAERRWRCVLTRDYTATFRDECRPHAAFQGIARILAK